MICAQITDLEFSLIESKVKKSADKIGLDDRSTGFLYLILDSLFPRSGEDISSLITDGGSDRGVDAVYIQESGNVAHISIVQSKYASTIKSAGRTFPGNEIDKLISFIRDLVDRVAGLPESVNPLLRGKIVDIWRLVDQGKMIYIHIFLVSNALPLATHERKRLDAFCSQYEFISVEELSYQSIISLISSDGRTKEDGILDTVDVQKYERADCDIRGLVANVDARSYIDMISNEGGKTTSLR